MNSTLSKPYVIVDVARCWHEDLRFALPAAVLARPAGDAVDLHTWVLVSEALEASAQAISCHRSGGQHAVTEVLVGYASKTTDLACGALPTRDETREGGAATTACAAWRHLERTWLRLAAQLSRPGRADVDLLRSTLHEQRRALVALQDSW